VLKRLLRRTKGQVGIAAMVAVALVAIIIVTLLPALNSTNLNNAISLLEGSGYTVAAPGEGWAATFWPTADNTYDLGIDGTNDWRDLFLQGNANIDGSLNAATGRTATFTVAATDSSTQSKAQADYVCDGLNDQVQIQAAIDALPYMPSMASYAGRVQLTEGNYHISAPIIMDKGADEPWGVWLAGSGQNMTYIWLDNNSDCNMIELVTRGYDCDGWKYITDLTLRGNKANQTTGSGIYQAITGGGGHWDKFFYRVFVNDCKDYGIYIEDSWGQRIVDCLTENCGGTGLYMKSSQGYISNLFSAYNGSFGIYLNGVISLSGFETRDSGASGLSASGLVQVTNGHIQTWNQNAGTAYGLYYPGLGGHFSNITIDGADGANTTQGVFLSGASEFTIIGNTVKGCTDYPFRLHNVVNGSITGNNIEAGSTGTVFSLTGTTRTLNCKLYDNYSDSFTDVLAINAIGIRSNEDLSAGIPITFTIDAQPDVPRTLSFHFDTHVNITEFAIELRGWTSKGEDRTETFDESDGWDFESSWAYLEITSITMTSRTGTGVGDTMDVGTTDVLGLLNNISQDSDIFKIVKNSTNQTVADAQCDPDYETYDMSAIGLAATDDFIIWYRSNLNTVW